MTIRPMPHRDRSLAALAGLALLVTLVPTPILAQGGAFEEACNQPATAALATSPEAIKAAVSSFGDSSAIPPDLPPITLPADQAAHPQYSQEWWWLGGHLTSGDRRFGFMINISRYDSGVPYPVSQTQIQIADNASGESYSQIVTFSPDDYSASSTDFEVSVPNAMMAGPLDAMTAQATLPNGSLDLSFESSGPPLLVAGDGLIPIGGGFSYYYSLPTIEVTGALTLGGEEFEVEGSAWMDHQFGNFAIGDATWRWKYLQLDNDVNVHMFVAVGAPVGLATILEASGEQRLAPVEFEGFDPSWTSPQTGEVYPLRWAARLPDSCLLIVTEPPQQQFLLPPYTNDQPLKSFYEGASYVTGGNWRGEAASGLSWNEQVLPPTS